MVDLLLIYPYFSHDNSLFKFPPLGIGSIAAYVREHGFSVSIIDCTFMKEEEVIRRATLERARVIGISCMSGMEETALRIVRRLRSHCDLLVAGGPLPSVVPSDFVDHFDLVVMGEGEEAMLEILRVQGSGNEYDLDGIAHKMDGKVMVNRPRQLRNNLDSLPFPARDLFDHSAYKSYFKKRYGYTISSLMASRGCPFDCEFCSRPVFGRSYRGRDIRRVVDEMEEIQSLGYDRIWVADDIFPLSKEMGLRFCDEVERRGLQLRWESLCRADLLDVELAGRLRESGCRRIFFGMESGNDDILRLMRKRTTVKQERRAVHSAKAAGLEVGGFFIMGYPGETSETMLDTIRVASSLPFDYLAFTLPYPIPGTDLYSRVRKSITSRDIPLTGKGLVKHNLIYRGDFSLAKLKFGIVKAMVQHQARDILGPCNVLVKPFELITDRIFRAMK